MKKLFALLMALSLLVLPCAAMAEGGEGKLHFDLTDIGIAIEVPAGWYTATPATAGDCSLSTFLQMTEAEMIELLESTAASFYAVCDGIGLTQFVLVSVPGVNLVDMRDDDLNMDAFMTGFLTSYSNVQDSGAYNTSETAFATVRYIQQDEISGDTDVLQYVTNVDGRLYLLQLMGMFGMPLEETYISQMQQIADSLTFVTE